MPKAMKACRSSVPPGQKSVVADFSTLARKNQVTSRETMRSFATRFIAGFLSLLLVPMLAVAQQTGTVSGQVTDAQTGETLPGATVQVVDTGLGTATDTEGRYEITDVPVGEQTVQVSFVGYQEAERTVQVQSNQTTTVNFELQPQTEELEEVVVVGYGEQERERLTGSVSSVSADEIQNQPVTSPEQLLQGRTAGVQVTSTSGLAGGTISVRVRGPSSVQSGSQPLYVVDGVPMISGTSASDFGQATNALKDLDPSNIESIEVLKDAAATAIYGSRGANGVVLISTKKGQTGETQVSFGAQVGTITPATEPWTMLNGSEWSEVYREGFANVSNLNLFGLPSGLDPNVVGGLFGYPAVPEPSEASNYNWVDEAFRDGLQQQYDLSVRGGTEDTRFFVSGSYDDQENYVIGNRFRRISGRLNVEHDPFDWMSVGANLNVSRSLNDRAASDNLVAAPLTSSALVPPIVPIRVSQEEDQTAEPGDYRGFNFQNPWNIADNVIATAQFNEADEYNWRYYGNTFIELNPVENLTLRAQGGADILVVDEFFRYIQESTDGQPDGFGAQYYREQRLYNSTLTANYTNTFADVHSIDLVGGASYEFQRRNNVLAEAQSFPSNTFQNVGSGALPLTTSSTVDRKEALESYFTRLNYSFDNRYIVELSARYDGSSKFGEGNQYGFFPAGSVAWRVSQESFMENVDFISEMKLRGSYGVTGNDQIGQFPALGLFGGGNDYARTPGIAPNQIPNPNLKWEEVTQLDVGLDLGVFNNRVFLTADYYTKTTNDLILNVPLPNSNGFNSYARNIGTMVNEGVDLSLETQNIAGDFQWSTTINLSYLRNEVTDLVEPIDSGTQFAREGEPLGFFNLIPYEGVDPYTGKPLWRNSEGELTTNPSSGTDRRRVGKVLPTWSGGITNRFSYAGITLSALVQFEQDKEVYNDGYAFMMTPATFNLHENYLNRWQEPGDVTSVPRNVFADLADNGTRQSSRWLENGSYIRLRDVTLSYRLPSSLTNSLQIGSARIYVKGTNLLTFDYLTDGTGDPEVSTGGGTSVLNTGVNFFTPPQQRTITGGVEVTL